jgi:hypothetical protein
MPLSLTNALWEVANAYHEEAEEDLTDSGRVVSRPEVIQMAPRGSVTISRLVFSYGESGGLLLHGTNLSHAGQKSASGKVRVCGRVTGNSHLAVAALLPSLIGGTEATGHEAEAKFQKKTQ